MALIVEDGTGLANAESYVSIAEIDTYATKFGKDSWGALNTTQKEINARKATRFADNKYPFEAVPLNVNQSLRFPATGFYVRGRLVTGIPIQMKDAVCELAIISITTDLVESVGGRAYTYRSVKVGDIEKTERYSSTNDEAVFYSVELILKPLLPNGIGRGVGVIKLRRA